MVTSYHLPQQVTPFIGRSEELTERAALLGDPACRLLTLVGPGGIGKTRLALEAAQQIRAPDGVYFVALQPLDSPQLMVSAIAEALDFQFFQAGEAQQQLLNYLGEKALLLVLDNFEHLLDGAEFVSDILASAPAVKAIVTSREALNLQEECLYPVKGMPFPQGDQPTNPEDYSAVRLFAQHARRIRADFSLSQEAAGVVRICALVEGMPLGLELAAAWVRALSCAEIADELERSLDILATPSRNAPARHRNMRAVLEQSWQLMSDSERDAFKRLSIFRGGITRQAADSIAGASLATLSALVDKSFLSRDANGRYTIHELLRQYGEERLNESPDESERAHDAHSLYFAEFVARREADVKGRRQLPALNEIEADFENVRAAWHWALRQRHYDAINSALDTLFVFCEMRGRFQEGKELFQQAQTQLEAEAEDSTRFLWGRLLTRGAWMWGLHGAAPERYEVIKTDVETSLAIAHQHEDGAQVGFCLWVLGTLTLFTKQYAQALAYLQQSYQALSNEQDRFYTARAADWLGAACQMNGQYDNFVKFSQQSLEMRRALGDRYGVAQALTNLAQAALDIGHYAEAERYTHEIGAIYLEIGGWIWMSRPSIGFALIAFQKGEFQKAKAFAEETLDIVKRSGRLTGGSLTIESALEAMTLLGQLAALDEDYVRSWELCHGAIQTLTPPGAVGIVQEGIAVAACGLEDYATAADHVMIALQRRDGIHDTRGLVSLLPIAAIILAKQGHKTEAVELIGMGFTRPASTKAWLEQWPLLTRLRVELETELGTEAYLAAWERGKRRDLDETVPMLLEHFGGTEDLTQATVFESANRSLHEPLSERELDVLRLIADGLSNEEIAGQLFVGVSTVKKHINHLYGKIGATSRTQAIVLARELNLL